MENIINLTLSLSGVCQKEPICGGRQGEHRATAVVFTPDKELSENLAEKQAAGKTLNFNVSLITEAGELFSGEEADISKLVEPFFLTADMTLSGLDSRLVLRISEKKDGDTREFLRTAVKLYFLPGLGYSGKTKKEDIDIISKKTEEALIAIEGKCAEAEGLVSEGISRMQGLQQTGAQQLKKVLEAATAAEEARLGAENTMLSLGDEVTKAKEYSMMAGEFALTAAKEAKAAEEFNLSAEDKVKAYMEETVGDISGTIDRIIALEENFIGGAAE